MDQLVHLRWFNLEPPWTTWYHVGPPGANCNHVGLLSINLRLLYLQYLRTVWCHVGHIGPPQVTSGRTSDNLESLIRMGLLSAHVRPLKLELFCTT